MTAENVHSLPRIVTTLSFMFVSRLRTRRMGIRTAFRSRALQGRSRVVLKTLLYRLLMVTITVLVALAVTGRLDQALHVGFWANLAKTATYYSYERCWDHVTWGLAGE